MHEIKLKKIGNAGEPALGNETVAIHKAIPPAVLRHRHLRTGDEYVVLPLARPDATGVAKEETSCRRRL